MSLSDEDREVLAPLFRDGYGFTGPATVEAIVARHVAAALNEAADDMEAIGCVHGNCQKCLSGRAAHRAARIIRARASDEGER